MRETARYLRARGWHVDERLSGAWEARLPGAPTGIWITADEFGYSWQGGASTATTATLAEACAYCERCAGLYRERS